MAKKKDEQLTYGQMPLPRAQSAYTRLKVDWSGLNRRQTTDTGVLSAESNISTAEAPYLTPSQSRYDMTTIGVPQYEHPISVFGFDGFIVVIYREGARLKIDYIELHNNGKQIGHIYTGYVTKRNSEGTITFNAVDESTDLIQRSMVQFNVYENAADVLDGVYVKKLLLFPDKVSMYMKIVTVNGDPNELYRNGEITDIDVMYYNEQNRRYYVQNGTEFVTSGERGYFMTDALDVVVKKFFNDGYALSEETTYNDGFRKTKDKYFNSDGYKPTKDTVFNDGYSRVDVDSGSYSIADGIDYYHRGGEYSPYTYTRAVLEEGDSLTGLYIRTSSGLDVTSKAYYRRTGEEYPYDYSKVAGLERGSSLEGFYEFVGSTKYPYTADKTYYTRKDTVPYEYEPVDISEMYYGKKLSGYYEKISDNDVEAVGYYKQSGEEPEYTYEAVKNLDYGSKVSKYYIKTGYYGPSEESNKNCYWQNTYNNTCYGYIENESGESGFYEALPPSFPNLKYAAVHLSRLFGVDESRVHVSGFNDYSNWNLDTVTETNESNAWSSAAQANTKANGEFTGITVYDNHVVCFKHDYMHEVYNNKNPFRIIDVYAEGTIDNRSIQEVGGRLIFVSKDGVKVYTGSKPRVIGYYLGIDTFTAAVSGSDGRYYYLYCEDDNDKRYLFVYDTFIEQWSEQSINFEVLGFVHNKNGMYMLTSEGIIYKLDTGKYNLDWWFETDLSTSLTSSSRSSYPTVDIKHLSKFQMLAYISKGANMKVYALYDGEDYGEEWTDNNKAHLLWESGTDREKDRTLPIRLKPRMTAGYSLKLHFEGHGYVRLYGMELRTTAGGELYR